MTFKPYTQQIAEQPKPRLSALCPTCGVPRTIFHDAKGKRYYVRHMQSGRMTWCNMSSKAVSR